MCSLRLISFMQHYICEFHPCLYILLHSSTRSFFYLFTKKKLTFVMYFGVVSHNKKTHIELATLFSDPSAEQHL